MKLMQGMVNELIFGAHPFLIGLFALLALRLGKSALIAFISIQGVKNLDNIQLFHIETIAQRAIYKLALPCYVIS